MHNLALALHRKGHRVSGSDDQIQEPSRSRLRDAGLLPDREGWSPDRITGDLDAVILGMHAKPDNPELLRAQALGLAIYSFPEFLYKRAQTKIRLVVGGSHGKTTITALILHTFRTCGISCDYLVGAGIEGFETMVGLEDDARFAVYEGDEYPSSPMDARPKFLHYRPHIAVISGISWDHANVFPTPEIYREQFVRFLDCIEHPGTVIYCEEDPEVVRLIDSARRTLKRIPYRTHPHEIDSGAYYLIWEGVRFRSGIFGRHNMQNISAARHVCREAGIPEDTFYRAMENFHGAARRLQCLHQGAGFSIYLDFAHAPSKVRATTQALRQLHPGRRLVACLELHTYSSLSTGFLPQYRSSLDAASLPLVFFDPRTLRHKDLPRLTEDQVREAFGNENLRVFTDRKALEEFLQTIDRQETDLLLMSSGTFSGMDVEKLAKELAEGF